MTCPPRESTHAKPAAPLYPLSGRIMSPGKRTDNPTPPPGPHVQDFKDIKDADFIDITPKDRGTDSPKGS